MGADPATNSAPTRCVRRPAYLLPLIIGAQFAGTSLWFAGNAVVLDLQHDWGLGESSLGYITSAVQLGFICGTLLFALLALADRFSPRRVFCGCAVAGAIGNAMVLKAPETLEALLLLRFITGFFLAGIYPVGMKIAAGWYQQGLGKALGFLVGALVLGTAFPHLLRGLGTDLPWQQVMAGVSMLALLAAVLILLVPDGPYLLKGAVFNPRVLTDIFSSADFRASALGYFGHMWELYALWTFIPLWLLAYVAHHDEAMNVSLWSALIIAAGFVGCAGGGLLSARWGSARIAAVQLLISGCCCALAPLLFQAPPHVLLGFLLLWGVTVAGDSPQLSALNARHAPPKYVGSALTMANSIGFLISVCSIQLLNALLPLLGPRFIFWLLIPGPVLGLWALSRLWRTDKEQART